MPVTDFGRIGRDADLRYTPDGTAVCNVPVAVEYGRKGQDGRKPTQWYELVLWAKQAEGLAQYLTKGKQIHFTGTDLHIETFQKNDGSTGTKLVCRSSEIKFASDGSGAQNTNQAPQQRPASAQAPQQQYQQQARQQAQQNMQQNQQGAAPNYDDFDDSIPF